MCICDIVEQLRSMHRHNVTNITAFEICSSQTQSLMFEYITLYMRDPSMSLTSIQRIHLNKLIYVFKRYIYHIHGVSI